jgi:hypothetical protein
MKMLLDENLPHALRDGLAPEELHCITDCFFLSHPAFPVSAGTGEPADRDNPLE